jgi:hypothetical protein
MDLYNCIWVVLLVSRLNLVFLSPKLSRGIDKILVYLCPCGFDNPRNTLRWKLLQLAFVCLRIILLGLSFANNSVKWFSIPTISRLLLLGIRVFRGPKLPKTYCKLIVGATTMERRDLTPVDAPIRAPVLLRRLLLHLPQPVEPTQFLLLLSKTMLMGESTMLLWKKPRKLLMLSLVCFLSMTLLQLCCLIIDHRILSYLLHMLGSIICP